MRCSLSSFCSFFFNDTATTEIYTLSLHDALPIYLVDRERDERRAVLLRQRHDGEERSEEHTSELQSRVDLVCRLLLEKKNVRAVPAQGHARDRLGRGHRRLRPGEAGDDLGVDAPLEGRLQSFFF